jgi:hypothetical protein
LLDKVGRDVSAGLARAGGGTRGSTVVIPKAPAPKWPRGSAAYAACEFLAQHSLAWGDNVALKPGPGPVTGPQLADAVGQLVVGFMGRRADEPQNRDQIEARPPRKSGK